MTSIPIVTAIIIVIIIAIVVIVVVGVTVLVLMRGPILPPLSLSRPCTHINSSSESHARLHHIGGDVTGVPVNIHGKNADDSYVKSEN